MTDLGSEFDPSLAGVTRSSVHDAIHRSAANNDQRLKDLLSQWVSEMEPTIHVGQNGVIAGIGSDDTVIIWAPGFPRRDNRTLSDWLRSPVW